MGYCVIDEAHNVAQRGTSSLRSKLAKLLSGRSDTLIMLSATPHDGKAESFASLMNMLDPTAIANPKEYEYADFADKIWLCVALKRRQRSDGWRVSGAQYRQIDAPGNRS